jgi:WD40 repeat protein
VAYSRDGKRIAAGGAAGEIVLWNAETGEKVRTIESGAGAPGVGDGVRRVAFSPDGKRLAAACGDGAVRVWSAETGAVAPGECLHRFGPDFALDVAFDPDGKRLAACWRNGAVRVWDAETGEQRNFFRGEGNGYTGVAFSPDGKWLAAAHMDYHVRVLDLATNQVRHVLRTEREMLGSAAFSPDGRLVAAGSTKGAVWVWDAETGRELHTLSRPDGNSVTGKHIHAVAFSPDSRRIASAHMNGMVTIWRISGGGSDPVVVQKHPHLIHAVAFSRDGKWGVSVGGAMAALPASGPAPGKVGPRAPTVWGDVQVWDAVTGREKFKLPDQKQIIRSAVFSPDSRFLVTIGGGTNTLYRLKATPGEVKVWDVDTGQEQMSLPDQGAAPLCVAFSPDGKDIATGGADGVVRFWEVPSARPEGFATTGRFKAGCKAHQSAVRSIAYRADGKRLATAGGGSEGPVLPNKPRPPGEVKVWDTETGEETLKIQGHTAAVLTVAFSPDGRLLASGSGDARVKIWDAEIGAEKLALVGHTSQVNTVAFSPDGARLLSGGRSGATAFSGELRLWSVATGQEKLAFKGPFFPIEAVAFSTDGTRLVAACPVGSVGLTAAVLAWDAPADR